jgi:hypothetical protein
MRAKVVSKDVGVKENGAKVWVALEYSLTCFPILHCPATKGQNKTPLG